MAKLQALAVLPISQDLLDKMIRAFPVKSVKDDDSLIAIGREAGKQEVVEFIKRHAVTRNFSGNPDDLIPKQPPTLLERVVGVFRARS